MDNGEDGAFNRGWEAGAEYEREQCAKIAEHWNKYHDLPPEEIALAIAKEIRNQTGLRQ